MEDDKKCPNCGSACVSSYSQAGGRATVYRFACGRRDRHWAQGMGSINAENQACKEIKRLRSALTEIANEDYRGNRPHSATVAYYALHPEKKP